MKPNFTARIHYCDVCDRKTIISESYKSDVRLCFDCAKEAAKIATPDEMQENLAWEAEPPAQKHVLLSPKENMVAKTKELRKEYDRLSSEVIRMENKITLLKQERAGLRANGVDAKTSKCMDRIVAAIKKTGYRV